jgi:hypothetical protein
LAHIVLYVMDTIYVQPSWNASENCILIIDTIAPP